jgi:hypothetical protein
MTVSVNTAFPHPLERMSEGELRAFARRVGMSVESLRRQAGQPHVSMTCPLCGRASSHLIQCQGCGDEAWGLDLALSYGEEAVTILRTAFAQTLARTGWDSEAIQHAADHAYYPGGCLLCAECRQQTNAPGICYTCPLFLLSEHHLAEPDGLPSGYYLAMLRGQPHSEWTATLLHQWTENQPPTVAQWRTSLLMGTKEKE